MKFIKLKKANFGALQKRTLANKKANFEIRKNEF